MHFYIHIPFCRQKCPYCKFALTPIFDDVKKKRYLGYLKKEIREYFLTSCDDTSHVGTIYFGGGTPSILSISEIYDILALFPRDRDTEISFECNPEDITTDYVSGLIELGINRLSIGVQSLNTQTLKAITRSDRESIFRAFEMTEYILGDGVDRMSQSAPERHIAGISVNADFILGLPHTKPGQTLEYIRKVHHLFPSVTHTSVYMLEDGLYPKEWKKDSISEDEMQREYSAICTYFDSIGWHHYEISSWSRVGYECRHNQGYWEHTDTRGFGLSATSYIGGERWENSGSFIGYSRGDRAGHETLTYSEKSLESLIYDLRTFRLSAEMFPMALIEKLIANDDIRVVEGKILLTPAGIFRENTILAELAAIAQLVEHSHGKGKVSGSSPDGGSISS